jgi:signal transduction histidine kinase
MSARDLVALIHLVGFATGIALYGMLALMTRRTALRRGTTDKGGGIALLAALLGLLWNVGALVVYGWQDFALGDLSPWITAISYSALGFLPAVVVDSATRSRRPGARPSPLAFCAYALSAVATAIQAVSVARSGAISSTALLTLTIGYVSIVLVVAVRSVGRTGSQRALTAVALAAFAVSALHLSRHTNANDSWIVELIGHHASLPLVLVILYQDYRFALADIFLKRALAILLLVSVVLAVYALALAPMLAGDASRLPIGLPAALLAGWIGTALAYPLLQRGVDRFVDRVVLGRTDYKELRSSLVQRLSSAATVEEALERGTECVQSALDGEAEWEEDPAADPARRDAVLVVPVRRHAELVLMEGFGVSVAIPTAEQPSYCITTRHLPHGRRLLSDDVTLLDSAALLIARRIDELRMADERYHRDLREHEIRRLAAVSELEALRAQLNPHFLFNALSAVGFLIRSSPSRALDTLYQLTSLLRAVLRRNNGEFVTLDEEMQIVDAYLAIESARYEERLTVIRDVPQELLTAAIPPLVLQPIVENAVKHGVSALRDGAVVRISAFRAAGSKGSDGEQLRLIVSDSGPGVSGADLAARRHAGVGLSNIERRLDHYYGAGASLEFESMVGIGTTVTLTMPLTLQLQGRSLERNDAAPERAAS